MRNIYKSFLPLVLAFLFFPIKGLCTHIVGGALTYTYNGGTSYTLKLRFYRDCSVATAYPATVTFNVLNFDGSAYITSAPGYGGVTNVPSNLDSCAVPPPSMPCVEFRDYTTTVNLPTAPGGYHVYVSYCCRNAGIDNITNPDTRGETFYAFIPSQRSDWKECFTWANGTTSDALATAWTRTVTGSPAPTGQVNTNRFETTGQNAVGTVTWTSQVISITNFSPVSLQVNLSEPDNLDITDTIKVFYSLNGGPLTLFTTNGQFADDFTTSVASVTGLVGTTIQIIIEVKYDAASLGERYRLDNVWVYSTNILTNDNPVFTQFPPLFLCQGKTFTFDHSATDTNGDSLVYSFYTPYNDPAPTFADDVPSFTPITYVAGYSNSSPINSGGPALTLNSSTGTLSGTPNILGQFVVGIKCTEYRNSILLGDMVRDFQFNVVTCPPPAQAGISGSALTGCRNVAYTFPNTSDAAATNWFWNFGNPLVTNDTSSLQYPSYTYTTTGTYTVTLIVNRGTSCADTATQTITISIPSTPTAGNTGPVCSGQTLTLTATNILGATYSWTGPNSFSSTSQNPTLSNITTASAGSYSVVATVGGCTGNTATTTVTVNQTPAAPVAGSNSPICSGQTLSLTASSTGTTYAWTGPSAYSSATQNPTIAAATTAQSGTYSVTATANGCTSTAGTTSVTVNAIPAAPTAGSNTPLCTGTTLSLTANTISGATYAWNGPNSFTSASQNPTIGSVSTLAAGTYSVFATVAGCIGPVGTTSVTVAPPPAAPTAGSNSPICVGANLSLTANTISGATYNWNGPNSFTSSSQNPVINGVSTIAAGTYSVNVTVGGCAGPAGTVTVIINPPPGAPTPGSSSPVCSGQTLSLTANTITSAIYNWNGPNGFSSALQNPTIGSVTALASGTYSVAVTVAGCIGTSGTTSVTILQSPSAPTAGNNSPICAGTTLSLTASTVGTSTYSWSGPNSFSSTSQNPTIISTTTADAGTYSVTAIENGCPSIAGTTSVTIYPIPVVTAGSNSPLCIGNNLSLTASTISGATYSWSGPNSFSSASQNPVINGVTTANAGTYSVVTTANGCIGPVATTSVTVAPPPATPTAGNNSPICAGTTLSLTASTVSGATYTWTGPNSFSSVSQNPIITSVTTLASGTYSVAATVAGCMGSAGTTSVTINTSPSAPTAGSNSPICVGGNLSLTANTIGGATYAWSGPNSFSSTSQNPVINGVSTLEAGTYSVNVTVAGCAGPDGTTAVIINPPPSAPTPGNNSPVCSGTTLSLTANTIANATYSWTGPNSFSSVVQNPTIGSVTTANAGTYSVTATVPGCPTTSAATTSVTINQTPIAPTAGSNSPICSGNDLSLTASTIGSAIYSWSGPNSFSSTSQNPTIINATSVNAGTYSVMATDNGCTGPAGTAVVTINPIPSPPTAGSNSPVCVGNNLSLTANTISGATYSWTGPNSFTSSSQNPVVSGVTTATAGTYSVSVTVLGCAGPTGTTSVTINTIPAAPTAGSNSSICSGTTLSLTASIISGATYTWSGPNSFTSALQNPAIGNASTLASGTYSVTATVSGCTGPAGTTSVTIQQTPSAPVTSNNGPLCVGDNLTLTAGTISGATYVWSGPNGFSSASQNPTIGSVTTTEAGTYSVTATVNGCLGPAGTTAVIVAPPPSAPTAGNNSPVCSGQTLSLTASTITGASYAWSGPNSFSSSSQNPAIGNVSTAAAGSYSVIATIGSCTGPVGTSSVTINKTPATPIAGSNSPICSGNDLSLTASTVSGATYAWSGPNNFSSSLQNPVVTAAGIINSGIYSITATENGCTSTGGTTSVTVYAIPSAPAAGNNGPLCIGDNLTLTANTISGATYAWSGPNGFTSASQNPTIGSVTTLASGTYSVTATVNGCLSPVATTSLIVAPPPSAPTAGNNSTICSGTTLSLTASTISGATYAWGGPNSFSSASQNPTIAGVTVAANGIYSVTAKIGSCVSPAGTTTVSIIQTPSTPTTGSNSPVCAGNDLSLTASLIGGATYAWSGPNSFSSASQNPTIVSVTTAEGGTYSVTTTENGCTSPAGTTTVIINPAPLAPIAGSNTPVCAGTTLSLTASSISGATSYSWSGPNTFSSSAQNPAIATVTTAAAGTYSVFAIVPGCPVGPTNTTTVTIIPSPVAPTAGNNSPFCSGGNTLSLTASTVGGATYNWSGPNSFSSTTQNPAIANATTANAGTYSVTATENGCTGPAGTTPVTIYPIPAAPTASNNGPLCIGDNLTLTANTISGATYAWNGPNGFSSSSQNPTIGNVTTLTSGTYSVTTTVNGCLGLVGTTSVTVAPPPSAPAAGNNSPVCSGTTLSLTASTITGASYTWNGPNSFTSSIQNSTIVNVSTASTGTYSVVATIGSCTSPVSTTSVTINPSPVAPTAASNSPLCIGDNLTLTASTIANATYNWNGPNGFSSTSQNPIIGSVTTAEAGTYSVSVTSLTNGCVSSTSTLSISITPPASANAGTDQTVCANNAVQLNGIITGGNGTGIWSTPNGVGIFAPTTSALNATYTPSINDTLAGDVILILSSTNSGCATASDTMIIHVNAGPVVNAGANQSICSNNLIININGSVSLAGGAQWSSTGTGTFQSADTILNNVYVPSVADVDSGIVILILTSQYNGSCSAVTDSILIIFTPSPFANAGADILVCFGDTSAQLNGIISGGATTGTWATSGSGTFFPNNTTLNATYFLSNADTAAGGVTLVLTSTNNGNCITVTDTVSISMTATPIVVAGSDITVCANNAIVSLNGNVSVGSTTGIWSSSGTGIFTPDSSALNASYSPSSADTAAGNITLTLTSTNSCRAVSDSLLITFTDAPIVNAGADVSICGGSIISLNGSMNSVASGVQWNSSGNGIFTPSNSALNASYTLGSNDTSNVTLVLTTTGNGQCLAATDTLKITIGKKPTAEFSNTKICSGQVVTFTDASAISGINNAITSWNWDFGNSNSSLLQNPSHTYAAAGTYTVQLIITTSIGCTDTVSHIVTAHPSPIASYTVLTNCSLDSVYFTDLSTIAAGNIISWNWNFGDTNTGSVQNPVHYYDSTGTHIVSLTVTSDSGCTATISDTVVPVSGVTAAFNYSADCQFKVTFDDVSVVAANDSIISWNWNFTGGSPSSASTSTPTITYSSQGSYIVTFTVTTANGCTTSKTDTITLLPLPIAEFTPHGGTYNAGQTIDFDNLSTNINSWTWYFGDGDSDTILNPSHTYSLSGTYTVALIVTNSVGCLDSVKYSFDINSNIVAVPSGFTPNGDGVNDILYVYGGPLKEMDWRIYNEWGNEIFHSTSQSEGWNGKYKGKIQPAARYVYILKGTTYGDTKIDMHGNATIIR